ncbi:MAG: hypothetical protein HKN47_26015 [Pirellulaceae bacterium]|nr:hypothetical protein [Pirellulaceae bacterium]
MVERPSPLRLFFQNFHTEKAFTLSGLLVGLTLVIVCGLDLAFAWPYQQASKAYDITFLLSGIVMLWLTWDVAKDQWSGRGRRPERITPKLQ